jgi:hypothetical protein
MSCTQMSSVSYLFVHNFKKIVYLFIFIFIFCFSFDVLQTDELCAGFAFCFVLFCFIFAFFSWAEIATNCESSRHRLSLCDTHPPNLPSPPPPHTQSES